jgi:hypothetical protein
MVVATAEFTKGAITLAQANKVELWDRNILSEKINAFMQCNQQHSLHFQQQGQRRYFRQYHNQRASKKSPQALPCMER